MNATMQLRRFAAALLVLHMPSWCACNGPAGGTPTGGTPTGGSAVTSNGVGAPPPASSAVVWGSPVGVKVERVGAEPELAFRLAVPEGAKPESYLGALLPVLTAAARECACPREAEVVVQLRIQRSAIDAVELMEEPDAGGCLAKRLLHKRLTEQVKDGPLLVGIAGVRGLEAR